MSKVKNGLMRIVLWTMGVLLSLGVFGAALNGTALVAKAAAPASYTTITECATMTANVTYAGEQKYYKFVPTTSGEYMFYSMGALDTYGFVYDANGNQLLGRDDGANGNNFSVRYNMTAGTTYYLGARIMGNATGNFSVYLSSNLTPTSTNIGVAEANGAQYSLFNSGRTGSGVEYSYDSNVNHTEGDNRNGGYDLYGNYFGNVGAWFTIGREFTMNFAATEKARLSILAFDVDEELSGYTPERDHVWLYDKTTNKAIVDLGYLSGMNWDWNTTTFEIDPSYLQQGHTYYFRVNVTVSGWEVWVRTVSLEINGDANTGTLAPENEIATASLEASISSSGQVNTNLSIQGNVSKNYTVEYKATHIETEFQRGGSVTSISVNQALQSYSHSFSLESGSAAGAYQITAYVKNANGVIVYTTFATAGYNYYTVSYNANGGSNNLPIDGTAYQSGNTVNVAFDVLPSRLGYIFLGWSEDPNAMQPTYTANGNTTLTVGNNDVVLYAIWIDENHEHTGNWTTILAPTCTADGIEEVDCTSCGKLGYRAIPALGHTWVESDRVAEDCVNDGYIEYACFCGATKRDSIPAHGHVWEYEVIYHNPTCTEDGYWEVNCENCAASEIVIDPNTATGHTYDNGTMVVVATCSTPGIMRYSCVNGCTHYYEEFVEADHSAYIYEESRVEATCEEDGVIYYACGACGHTSEEVIEAQGHEYTYTDNGDGTHDVYCTACGDSFTEAHDNTRRVCICGYRNNAYIDVLLIQDNAPWSTASNENVLNALKTQGYIDNWNKCTTSDIVNGRVTFESYSLILFANDQTDYTYGNYARFADQLTAYVENGGALVFGACDEGWRGGSLSAPLPGGVTTTFQLDRNNRITDTTNDIVLGTYTDGVALENNDLVSSYCSHVYFNNIPNNANVVFENTSGRATLIEYALGDGYVVATGLTWEYSVVHCSYADFADIAYDDMIVAALSQVGAYQYEKYLVEFVDFDGTLINAQRIESGETPAEVAEPEREGYTFIGWDVNNDSVVDYFGNLPAISEDTTFVALYKINQYSVSLSVEGNGSVSGDGSFNYGATTVLNATADQYNVFVGWYLNGVCLSTDATYVYTVGASNVEIVAMFRSQEIAAEVEITSDKPAYKQGEAIVVTLTLKNITDVSGIASVVLTELRCNGAALTVNQMSENAYLTGARYVGTASGWSVLVNPWAMTVTASGPAVTQDGEVAVEVSIVITAQRDSDLTFEIVGSGVNGNGEACLINFTPLTIGVTCAHTSTHAENAVAPTCTQKGYTGDIVCDDCGHVEAGEEIDKVEHDYVFFSDGEEGNCVTPGFYYEKCANCTAIRQVETFIGGHTPEAMQWPCVEPTCTEGVYRGGTMCSRCGEIITPPTFIPPVGHSTEVMFGYEATCTEDGLTDSEYCYVCGEVLVEAEVIPAYGHSLVYIPGYNATCTEDGRTDSEYCNVCGEVLVEAEVIPAYGHSLVYVYGYEATCTQDGLTDSEYCEVCFEEIIVAEVIPALGHNTVYVPGYAPTCTENGLTDCEFCDRCGVTFAEAVVIPALGHVSETIPGYAATCTEEGLTDGEYCLHCGETLVEQTVIPAAHVPGEWTPFEYDQFGRVVKEQVLCTACGMQLDLRIPAPEHNAEVIVEGYEATCTESGLTAGVYCEECGVWVIPQEEIPALGHNESDWTAVYDQNGKVKYEEKTCGNCGLQLDMRIPADNDDNHNGNGNGNGGGVDIYDNEVNVGTVNVGCSGTIGMVGILPCAAFLGGLMIRRKRNSINTEEVDKE